MIDQRGIGLGFREILTMWGFDGKIEIDRIERGNFERAVALRKVEENIVLGWRVIDEN
jgi:hypothetical protein